MLLAYVPNIFGFYWSKEIEAMILKPYNYSMGILALVVAGTTAKNLADNFNRDMPVNRQINNISALMAAIVGFLIVGVDSIEGGFANGYMGSKGLLTAFLVAFVVCNVYRFCVKRNVTIKMPDAVPPNISQTFADVIPFAVSAIIFTIFDIIFRNVTGICFAQGVIEFFQPLILLVPGSFGNRMYFRKKSRCGQAVVTLNFFNHYLLQQMGISGWLLFMGQCHYSGLWEFKVHQSWNRQFRQSIM